MIKRFFILVKQDLLVALRNYFHYAILFLVLLMVVVVNFVIPQEVKLTPTEIFYDGTINKVFESYLLQEGVEQDRIFQSKNELIEKVKEQNNRIGIIMEGTLENAVFTTIHQGSESTEILNVLDATIETTLDQMRGVVAQTNHRIEYLRPKSAAISFNKNMIPLFMVAEVIMLGFMLIAVMVFQEKEEGSVRAYRVSPGGVLEYILSKAVVNLILALVYGGLVVLFTMGLKVNYLALFSVIVLANFLMTLIGLSISVFFRSLQEFLFVGVAILAITALPMISYLTPSFAPKFITWLPSFPVLFGIREILFPSGKVGFIASLNWVLLVESILFLGISYFAVLSKLMKEGKK